MIRDQQDPWAAWNDPWARGRQGGADEPMPSSTTRLDAVQEDLQQKIEEKVAASNEQRFSRLEVDMAELKQQGIKHEAWFRDAAAANSNTQRQLQELTMNVTENQKEIGQVKSEIQAGFARIFVGKEAQNRMTNQSWAQENGSTLGARAGLVEMVMDGFACLDYQGYGWDVFLESRLREGQNEKWSEEDLLGAPMLVRGVCQCGGPAQQWLWWY